MERSGIEMTTFEEIGNLYEVLKVSTYNAYDINDVSNCLLYTSDAADDMQCVDLGGGRII